MPAFPRCFPPRPPHDSMKRPINPKPQSEPGTRRTKPFSSVSTNEEDEAVILKACPPFEAKTPRLTGRRSFRFPRLQVTSDQSQRNLKRNTSSSLEDDSTRHNLVNLGAEMAHRPLENEMKTSVSPVKMKRHNISHLDMAQATTLAFTYHLRNSSMSLTMVSFHVHHCNKVTYCQALHGYTSR